MFLVTNKPLPIVAQKYVIIGLHLDPIEISLKAEFANLFYWRIWCPHVLHYLASKRQCDWSIHYRDNDVQRVWKNVSPFVLLYYFESTNWLTFPTLWMSISLVKKQSITSLCSVKVISYIRYANENN